jgi:uncharacterized repeat protein (TIGR01451 family)
LPIPSSLGASPEIKANAHVGLRPDFAPAPVGRPMISRSWWQIVLGWSFVSLVALGQSPVGAPFDGPDPNCPTCNKNRGYPQPVFPQSVPTSIPIDPAAGGFAGPLLPGVTDGPPLEGALSLPPTALPIGLPGRGMPAGLGEEADECPLPVIKIRLKAPTCAVVGKEVEYRFRVENCTPTDAHHVIVRASVPASVRVLRTSPVVHAKEPELQWNLGTLAGFGCHDLSVVVVPIGLADVKFCTRVQFEYGQCATTKVIATAPDGSEGGAGGMGIPGGPYGPGGIGQGGAGGIGTREPGVIERRRHLDVSVFGPEQATVGDLKRYQVVVINRSELVLRDVSVSIALQEGLKFVKASDNILELSPLLIGWPNPLIKELPPGGSKTLDLDLRGMVEGVFCLSAKASGLPPAVDVDAKICTRFVRIGGALGGPGVGLTMEMFDLEDPILKDGKTSYPIEIKNQGTTPATNVRVKAKIPALLERDKIFAPVNYREGFDENHDYWVVFEPIQTLAGGETQTFNIGVKAKGQEGDARFHVEMTADQLTTGKRGEETPRWIIEQESTTIVPDQESLFRAREISRKNREKLRITVP